MVFGPVVGGVSSPQRVREFFGYALEFLALAAGPSVLGTVVFFFG